MGTRNVLIEGVSGSGKTSVCHELRRRGFQAINGDTDLAYQGDPETGQPTTEPPTHWHHIWDVEKVKDLADDHTEPLTFFCGGSRNLSKFLPLFDAVFVLGVDRSTLTSRLDRRPHDEFGAVQAERDLILQLHQTGEGIPKNGIPIDATSPLPKVVDEIVRLAEALDDRRP